MSHQTLSQQYGKPCSMCTCGHTGDGSSSQHHDRLASNGHGACKECGEAGCPMFTWDHFTPEFEAFVATKKS